MPLDSVLPPSSQIAMQRIALEGQHRSIQGMVSQGIERLSPLGAEGQQWARRLRENPEAAMAMAEQYGGFQQIEAGLRYAASNKQGATANAMTRMGLEIGGGKEAALVGNAFSSAQSADTPKTISDALGAPRILGGDRHGQLAFANDSPLGGERSDKILRPRQVRSAKYNAANDIVKQALTVDVTDTAWERALIVLSNKAFDNSAVMQGEADSTVAAMLSVFEQVSLRIKNLMQVTGNVPLAERKQLQRMILESQRAVLEEALPEWQGWADDNVNQYGFRPGSTVFNYTIPGMEVVNRSVRFLGDINAQLAQLNEDPDLMKKDAADRRGQVQEQVKADQAAKAAQQETQGTQPEREWRPDKKGVMRTEGPDGMWYNQQEYELEDWADAR